MIARRRRRPQDRGGVRPRRRTRRGDGAAVRRRRRAAKTNCSTWSTRCSSRVGRREHERLVEQGGRRVAWPSSARSRWRSTRPRAARMADDRRRRRRDQPSRSRAAHVARVPCGQAPDRRPAGGQDPRRRVPRRPVHSEPRSLRHRTWRMDKALAGRGTLLEHSIHDVDMLQWMFGPVERGVRRDPRAPRLRPHRRPHRRPPRVRQRRRSCRSRRCGTTFMERGSLRHVEVFCDNLYVKLEGDRLGPVRWQFTGEVERSRRRRRHAARSCATPATSTRRSSRTSSRRYAIRQPAFPDASPKRCRRTTSSTRSTRPPTPAAIPVRGVYERTRERSASASPRWLSQ